MDKEYTRVQFGVDSKKVHFKTNNGNLTEVKFKIYFPDKFEFLKAQFIKNNLIRIDFKGLEGCEVSDSLGKSKKEETKNIRVELDNFSGTPDAIKVQFELLEVENCKKDNFVPETAGGGILVGTGG